MEILKKKYPLVSVFKSVTDTTPFEQKPLNEILMQIHNCIEHHIVDPCRQLYREGNTDAYSEKKKSMKCFTTSGKFEDGRKAEHLKEYSGFIILDIDKVPDAQVKPLKDRACAMPLTFCCFISPSGAGLKIIVRVSSDADRHTQAFNQLKAIYEKELGVEIDKSGKDVNRLCFYSCDREIFVNEDSRVFTPQYEQPAPLPLMQHHPVIKSQFSPDPFEKCVQLTENLHRFTEGDRNNFVHLLAANCNRQGIAENEAAQKIKAQYNYNDAEVSATIRSVYNNNRHEHGKFALRQTAPPQNKSYSHNGVVPLGELIERHKQEPPIPFIWSGIKKGSFGFVFGPPKCGKTTFCENLAMCLAAQLLQFFGVPITPDVYRVLFISLEEYWQSRTERNKKQAQMLTENLGTDEWMKNYLVVNEQVPRLIASDEDWEEIERMIRKHKANIVFIDSLSRLYQGGIEDSGLAKNISLRLRELSNKLNITLIVIHHTPKQFGKPITIDSLAGSRVLGQEADFLIGIGKSPDNKRYVKEVSFRYCEEKQEGVTLFDIDGNQWLAQGAEMPEAALLREKDGRTDDTNPEAVFEFIKDKTLAPKGETYTSELSMQFVTSGIMSKQTLFNSLDRLMKDERITKHGKGVYKAIL